MNTTAATAASCAVSDMLTHPTFWVAVLFTAVSLCFAVFALVSVLSGTSCHRWYAKQQMERSYMRQLEDREALEFEEWLATQTTPPPPPPTQPKQTKQREEESKEKEEDEERKTHTIDNDNEEQEV